MFVFFFFKQKTAYEMRISDWSSDVCSSDLERQAMALIRKFPLDPGLNFIGQRNIFLAIAALITVASVAITIVQGLNFGVDFRGGLLLEASLAQPADLGELRNRQIGRAHV